MRIFKYFAITLLLLILALPFALKQGIIYGLEKQGANNVSINSVYLNIFTGRLEIGGMHLYGADDKGLHFDSLLVDVSLKRLLGKQALIEELVIRNFRLDVSHNPEETIIAGLKLPTADKSEKEPEPEVIGEPSEPWGVGIEKLTFDNVNFLVNSNFVDSEFKISKLNVKSIYSWLPTNTSQILLDLKINDNPVYLESSVKLFDETLPTEANLKITNLQLRPFIAKQPNMPFDTLDVQLNSDLKTIFTKQGDIIKVNTSGSFSLDDMNYSSADQDIKLGQLLWEGQVNLDSVSPLDINIDNTLTLKQLTLLDKASKVNLTKAKTQLNGAYHIQSIKDEIQVLSKKPTNIKIEGIDANNKEQAIQLLGIDNINIGNIDIKSLTNIEVKTFGIDKLTLAKNLDDDKQHPLLSLKKLATRSISYQDKLISIDSINLDTLNSTVVVSDKGEISQQKKLESLSPKEMNQAATDKKAETTVKTEEPVKPADKTHIVIKEFLLNGKSNLNFTDNSVTPVFHTRLHEIQVTAKNINSTKPNSKLNFAFKSNADEYGTLNFSGDLTPFSPKMDANIKGEIGSIELVPLSAYSGKAAGIHIKRGILHADISGNIKKDIMDINNVFIFDQLKVESDGSEASKDFLASLPMPLDLLLDVLRDKQNRIELEIPVTGDVKDPQFSLQDVYNTATQKALEYAATRYLTQMVQPLGLIMTAHSLAKMAMAPKFEPLIYAPGTKELSSENKKHLDNIGKLLVEREKLRFTLCGSSAQADWPELMKTFKQIPADDKDFKTKSLLKLASNRTQIAKQYLVKEKSIDPKRLLSCNPKILKDEEDKPAKPQLEISL